MNLKKTSQGMTLIEVMIVLVIAGISLNVAIPAFSKMIARNTAASEVNEFLVAVNLARSEALKIGNTVSIQAVDPSDDENEFGPGYCVVAGDPGDCDGTIIQRFDGVEGTMRLNSVEQLSSIAFGSQGGLSGGAVVNVDMCSQYVNRRIYISFIGRSKSHSPDDDTVARRPTC